MKKFHWFNLPTNGCSLEDMLIYKKDKHKEVNFKSYNGFSGEGGSSGFSF